MDGWTVIPEQTAYKSHRRAVLIRPPQKHSTLYIYVEQGKKENTCTDFEWCENGPCCISSFQTTGEWRHNCLPEFSRQLSKINFSQQLLSIMIHDSWKLLLDVAWIQRICVFGESLSEIFSGEQEGGESGSHNTTAIISKFRSDKRSMSVRESGICIIVQPPLTNGSLALLVEELEEESGVQWSGQM